VLAGLAWGAYAWSQSRYYLADSDGVVTIYRGVNTNLFGLSLSHKVKKTSIEVSSLPQSWQDQLDQGIAVDSYDAATERASFIKSELDKELAKQQAEEEAKKQATESSNSGSSSSSSSNSGGSSSDGSSDSSGSDSTPKIGAADDATKSDTSKDGAAQ
ncbi:phosphoprotein phosphatase, partial [Bifidobacterium amazonense]|nr:phosphoprotein phosphatase [Bifidobacterium amazonense]